MPKRDPSRYTNTSDLYPLVEAFFDTWRHAQMAVKTLRETRYELHVPATDNLPNLNLVSRADGSYLVRAWGRDYHTSPTGTDAVPTRLIELLKQPLVPSPQTYDVFAWIGQAGEPTQLFVYDVDGHLRTHAITGHTLAKGTQNLQLTDLWDYVKTGHIERTGLSPLLAGFVWEAQHMDKLRLINLSRHLRDLPVPRPPLNLPMDRPDGHYGAILANLRYMAGLEPTQQPVISLPGLYTALNGSTRIVCDTYPADSLDRLAKLLQDGQLVLTELHPFSSKQARPVLVLAKISVGIITYESHMHRPTLLCRYNGEFRLAKTGLIGLRFR